MPCVCAAVNHLSTDFAAMETWLKCLVLSLAWTASAFVARAPRPALAAALRRSTRHDVALMAATLTDPTTTHAAATETTSGAPDYARFDWLDHW